MMNDERLMGAHSPEKEMIAGKKNSNKGPQLPQFLRVSSKLLFHPGAFFEELSQHNQYAPALLFLFACSILFTLLASIFVVKKNGLLMFIFFMNSFFMPFVTAFILHLVGILLCHNVFTFQILFGITAYANVTLLAAWIPGMAWVAGIWKFYLIGLGMVKVGHISGLKAFFCLVAAATILLVLIYLLQPVLRQ
jgi:hypothetical protein